MKMSKRSVNKNSSHNNKQKKTIETRLIQISLVMDDYVYKNKEISISDAEWYIQEISSYKNICIHDPRSLQVIEKLTKCLKTIINSYKDSENEYDTFNANEIDSQAVCKSPVYSLADDDREHLAQTLDETHNIDIVETNKCIEVIDLCNENELGNKETRNENLVEKNTHIGGQKETTNNFDINITASEIHLVDEEELDRFVISSEINMSQSILNFQDTESQDFINSQSQVTRNLNNISKNVLNIHQLIEQKQSMISHSYDIFTEIDYSQSILNNSGHIENDELITLQTQIECAPNEVDGSQSMKDQPKTVNDTPELNAISRFELEKVTSDVNLNKVSEKDHLENVSSTTATISGLILDNNIPPYYIPKHVENNVGIHIKDEIKKKKVPRKRKTNDTSQQIDKTKEIKCKPRKKNDSTKINKYQNKKCRNKVSNKNINNPIENSESSIDFSWIENLKYVREVSTTESHKRSKKLSLNFWENYSLPSDWDDTELMYKE